MKAALLRLRQRLAPVHAFALASIPDALLIAGAASVAYGAWLIYPPAGFIVGGLILLIAGVLASRGST